MSVLPTFCIAAALCPIGCGALGCVYLVLICVPCTEYTDTPSYAFENDNKVEVCRSIFYSMVDENKLEIHQTTSHILRRRILLGTGSSGLQGRAAPSPR
jgi:hypothetical protein